MKSHTVRALSLAILCIAAACPEPGPPGGADLGVDPGAEQLEILVQAYAQKYLSCLSAPDPIPEGIRQYQLSSLRAALGRITRAKGTGFTPSNMLACAKALEGLACEALAYADGPPEGCRFTGTQPAGGACLDESQCQSGFCNSRGAGPSACGVCTTPAAVGQGCSDTAPCARGAICIADKCVARADVGAPCDGNRPCKNGLGCVAAACAAPAKLGAACGMNGANCALGLLCQGATCVAAKLAGADCDPAAGRTCTTFYSCDNASRKCVTQGSAALGQACDQALCREGYCDTNKRCVAFVPDGQACDNNGGGCLPNSSCTADKCVALPACP